MPVQYNTGEWFTLNQGNIFRKIDLNTEWPYETDFGSMMISASPYGGPVAVVRHTGTTKPAIRIYSASGTPISIIDWNSGSLLTMGWSDKEDLVCVREDGVVIIYNMFGEYQHNFSICQEAKDTKVVDARIFPSASGTGVSVMTTKLRIFLINNINVRKNRQLPEMPKSAPNLTCWEIVPEEQNTFALVIRGKEIYSLRQGDSVATQLTISMQCEYQSIVMISVSFNQKHVALYTNNGYVWMGSADLRTKYGEFETGQSKRPNQISWCLDPEEGNNASAIVISYPSLLLIIGLDGGSTTFSLDPTIILIPEMDCVRILTNTCHEMIQKVPKCVNNIFAINSQEPSSFLFEAHKKFQERSHQSDEYLCLIKDHMNVAVNECIDAAVYEFDPETQKSLIRAAYFGKAFIPSHNPDKYIEMCRILRVLNAIRDSKVDIPLTFHQFIHLRPSVVLDRLVFRKHYGLAIQIAKHMKLTESRILEHWATYKVVNDKNDNQVAHKISEKFKNACLTGISFCNIAKTAQENGRKGLAIKLLDYEPKCSNRVPLLMEMGENEKALVSATMSGDTDLIYMVLLRLMDTENMSGMQMKLFPIAQNLYKKYCRQYQIKVWKNIIDAQDDHQAQAECFLRERLDQPENLSINLSSAATSYKRTIPPMQVESDLCEEARKLLKIQKSLSEKYSNDFSNLSVSQTITKLLQLGDLKTAEKVKNDFKVPERKFWWLRIQNLVENSQWEELEKFSKSKKSPIGYEPFVELCLKHHKTDEAKKYLPKCREAHKVKWLIRAGLLKEAGAVAFEQRDLQSLYIVHELASRGNDQELKDVIENYCGQLSRK